MADYLYLADARYRDVLLFVTQQGIADHTDLRREFMDAPPRELGMVVKKLTIADLLNDNAHKYSINYDAFDELRQTLGIFNPTDNTPPSDRITHNGRILGQLCLRERRNRDTYLALRRAGEMRWGEWCQRSGLDIKAPNTWREFEVIKDSGMVAVHNALDGDIILRPTSNRMGELYHFTRQILGEL